MVFQVDLVKANLHVTSYRVSFREIVKCVFQVIYTVDEVNYIQNLVYYVERSYRVTDYGCWERGTKYNNRTTELHARYVTSVMEVVRNFRDQTGPLGLRTAPNRTE